MPWFAYAISPIDFGWDNLQTVEDFARELGGRDAFLKAKGADMIMEEGPQIEEFLDDWQSAKEAAYSEGWDGDTRQGPVVFWVPTSTTFQYGFAFKQDNNGITFVISRVPMPWLDGA